MIWHFLLNLKWPARMSACADVRARWWVGDAKAVVASWWITRPTCSNRSVPRESAHEQNRATTLLAPAATSLPVPALLRVDRRPAVPDPSQLASHHLSCMHANETSSEFGHSDVVRCGKAISWQFLSSSSSVHGTRWVDLSLSLFLVYWESNDVVRYRLAASRT